MQMTQCESTIIYPEAMTSFGGVNKINELKRTSVQVTPRASLCTVICDLRNTVGDRYGAFALIGVRARKLRGLYD